MQVIKLESKKHKVSVHKMENNFFSVITTVKGFSSNINIFKESSSATSSMIHNFKRLETNT